MITGRLPRPAAQRGVLLMELLVVFALIAIVAGITTPMWRPVIVEHDLNSARDTVLQSLQQAKQMARTRSTRVTVSLSPDDRRLHLRSADGRVDETVPLPSRVTVAANTSVVFSPLGTVGGAANVTLRSRGDANQTRTITISPMGGLAAM